MRQILQIIPASGWYAVEAGRLPGGEVVLRDRPLACWALIEDEDEDGQWEDVVGMVAEGDALEECYLKTGFVGYHHAGESIERWRGAAERIFSDGVSLEEAAVPGD